MSDFTPEQIRILRAFADGTLAALGGGGSSSSSGAVAGDADLDDPEHGDPLMKFLPKRWKGRTYIKDTPFSRLEPDLLDVIAEALEYSANNPKEGKEKYARFDKLDASRARGWAARMRRDGYQAPAAQAAPQRPAYAPPPAQRPNVQRPAARAPEYDDLPGEDELPF